MKWIELDIIPGDTGGPKGNTKCKTKKRGLGRAREDYLMHDTHKLTTVGAGRTSSTTVVLQGLAQGVLQLHVSKHFFLYYLINSGYDHGHQRGKSRVDTIKLK